MRVPATSIRSLTTRRFPCSGPGSGAAGSSSVTRALYGVGHVSSATASISTRAPSSTSFDTSTSVLAGRVDAEHLAPDLVDRGTVTDVGEEDRDLDDIGEARTRGGEDRLEVREDLARLRDDVVAADEAPVAVDRDASRDEEEVARTDGVGVVADRLGELGNADLLAPAHPAPARTALSVVRGVIASGSILSATTAGLPAPSARSSASGNSSVRVMFSPCAPNDSA